LKLLGVLLLEDVKQGCGRGKQAISTLWDSNLPIYWRQPISAATYRMNIN